MFRKFSAAISQVLAPRLGVPEPVEVAPQPGPDAKAWRPLQRQFDQDVEEVLEDVGRMWYGQPLPLWPWYIDMSWYIGRWNRAGTCRIPWVEVSLIYGPDGQPKQYLCQARGRTVTAELTREDLARALVELHTSREART